MSEFPGSPKIQKGAIVALDPLSPLSRLIRFQYNPMSVTRSLRPNSTAVSGGSSTSSSQPANNEALKIDGPPIETITLKLKLDATDQLEADDSIAKSMGIHPQLAALEILMYPTVHDLIGLWNLEISGISSMNSAEVPITLFYWGPGRIQPVRITSMNIDETNFDVHLNPIQADITLSMETLSYNDLPSDSPATSIYLAYQLLKEGRANLNGVRTALSAL